MKRTAGLIGIAAISVALAGPGPVWAGAAVDKAAARAAASANRKAAIEQKKAEAAEKRAATAEDRKARRKKLEEKGKARIDKRQDNQAKRINHGIAKGYLTADEVAKLQAQQASIANLESSALADGKLTKNEFVEIRAALNDASRCIWAEKHNTEGNQMPTYVLGKNVFAKDDLTSKLESENLSPEETRALMGNFRRMMDLKRQLSTGDLSDAERAALQAEYDTLLNQYFEVR